MRPLLPLLLAACTGSGPGETGASTDELPADTDDSAVLVEDIDCEALSIDVSGTLDLGTTVAWGERLSRTITFTNPCARSVRFLGHPDDWVQGEGFGIAALPPVRLDPGESTTLAVGFTPGEAGSATGGLSLPFDADNSPLDLALSATVDGPPTLVFVGEGRRVSTTADYGATWRTDTWDTLTAHTNALQRGSCHGPAGHLAVGGSDQRNLWWSTDGQAWTADTTGGGWIADCAYGNGTYLLAGGFGILETSADGSSWSTGGVSSGGHLRAVGFGSGRWVAVGDDRIAVSADGQGFLVDRDAGGAAMGDVAYGNGVWVVGGERVFRSTDGGETWTEQVVGAGTATRGIAFVDGQFWLANGQSLYASADGAEWALVNGTSHTLLGGIGQRLFAASGAALYRSADGGFSWQLVHADDGGPGYADLSIGASP